MSRVGKKDCRVEKKKQGGLKKTNPGVEKNSVPQSRPRVGKKRSGGGVQI